MSTSRQTTLASGVAVLLLGMNFWSSRVSIRHFSVPSTTAYADELSAIIAVDHNHDRETRGTQDPAGGGAPPVSSSSSSSSPGKAAAADDAAAAAIERRNEERPQPHTGARDANGRLGYVADPTRVRRWMLGRYLDETMAAAAGAVGRDTIGDDSDDISTGRTVPPLSWTPARYATNNTDPCGRLRYSESATRAILKIVPDHPGVAPYPEPLNNGSFVPPYTNRSEEYEHYDVASTAARSKSPTTTAARRPRLLCAMYTHAGKHEQVTAVHETWGYKCDGFLAASTMTVEDDTAVGYGAVNLTHAGPEHYGNMWQKTRSILAYLHDHYRHDYDYFWVGGDDAYLVVENVKRWLAIVEDRYGPASTQTEPLYLGHHVKAMRFRFAGGGPGYVLNRPALEIFFQKASACQAYAEVSAEDRYLGMCFHDINVSVQDTADARGQQRFIGYDPELMAKTTVNNNFFRSLFQTWIDDHPRTTMGPGLVSEQAFGLHWFRTPELLHHLHAVLYRTCPIDSVVGQFVTANDPNRTTVDSITSPVDAVAPVIAG